MVVDAATLDRLHPHRLVHLRWATIARLAGPKRIEELGPLLRPVPLALNVAPSHAVERVTLNLLGRGRGVDTTELTKQDFELSVVVVGFEGRFLGA